MSHNQAWQVWHLFWTGKMVLMKTSTMDGLFSLWQIIKLNATRWVILNLSATWVMIMTNTLWFISMIHFIWVIFKDKWEDCLWSPEADLVGVYQETDCTTTVIQFQSEDFYGHDKEPICHWWLIASESIWLIFYESYGTMSHILPNGSKG